ncbi:hypothetical protein C8F01DRAFT_42232 [Mycena amicta]|nr:hypothetical protein C8F01DRAFT_42232 [Mycena amicta]
MTTPRSEACLPLLPQDILSEVCAYLGPQELYNLSKTAKQLRIFLTSRSNAGPIWRRAFHRAVDADGLPRASPGVQCDLQWAELLYGRSCSACLINLENPLQYTFWPFNVRLCTNCFPSLVQRRLPPDLARRVRTEYWSGLFPSVSQTHTQTSLYLSREVETFKRRASSLTRDELEQFLIQQRQLTTLKMEARSPLPESLSIRPNSSCSMQRHASRGEHQIRRATPRFLSGAATIFLCATRLLAGNGQSSSFRTFPGPGCMCSYRGTGSLEQYHAYRGIQVHFLLLRYKVRRSCFESTNLFGGRR